MKDYDELNDETKQVIEDIENNKNIIHYDSNEDLFKDLDIDVATKKA